MKQILTLIFLCSALLVFAQTEEKKVIKTEKVVKVEVNNDGISDKTVDVHVDEDNGERMVTIKTIQDGEESILKWKDNGEIPDDIREKLEESDIDVQILEGKGAVFIGEGPHVEEKVIIIEDGDGKVKKMEWDGEGEMPKEMRKMMRDHDIDLGNIKKGGKGKKMKMRMMKMDKDRIHGNKMMWKGEKGNRAAKRMSKTYLGAQIGTSDEGTEVLDVMVDSPAHKAGLKKGDIITEINGANTKNVDDLMMLLSLFDANDTVEVEYNRSGKKKSAKVKLAERPKPYR